MGRSLRLRDKNTSSPVLLTTAQAFFGNSFAPSLTVVSYLISPLLLGYLLPGFAGYRWEAGANLKTRAGWCSLFPDLPLFQGL